MKEVVINKCYGGFGLSDKAHKRYAEIKGITIYPEPSTFGHINYYTVPAHERPPKLDARQFGALSMEERQAYNKRCASEHLYDHDIPRDDAALVQTVRELGKEASGRFASLKIVRIPDDIEWEIDEYDGLEHVAQVHETWG